MTAHLRFDLSVETVDAHEVHRLSAALDHLGPPPRSMISTVPRVMVELNCSACLLHQVSDDGHWLQITACHDRDPWAAMLLRDALAVSPHRVGQGLVGNVVETGALVVHSKPLGTDGALGTGLQQEYGHMLDPLPIHSAIVIPLPSVPGKPLLGALTLLRPGRTVPFIRSDLLRITHAVRRMGAHIMG